VSWSHCGSYLAVSGGDNLVTIFSENVDGSYEEISQINQENNIDNIDHLSNNQLLLNNGC
jgi:WD40 repeat protein